MILKPFHKNNNEDEPFYDDYMLGGVRLKKSHSRFVLLRFLWRT